MTYKSLKSRIDGTVITEFDPGHGEACDALIWNGRKPQRQARIIVRAASVRDVQEAVRYAAEHDLTVSARGGGHQFTGIAARADMVVDLGALDTLRLDLPLRRAIVGPAVTNARLAAALDRHGLAFPVGHCGSVTISGYLLGGGVGWNSNEWGMACFSVRALDVVMADGRILTASAIENADIFWAARGAGPDFFGIVTAFHVDLFEAPRAAITVVRVYPAARIAEVADWAEHAIARAPSTVEFTAKVQVTPEGPVIAAIAAIFATTEADADAIAADLGSDAPVNPIALIGPDPAPFSALYEATGPSTPMGSRYGVDCFWSDGAFGSVLSYVVQGIATAPSNLSFGLVALRSNAKPLPDGAAFSCDGRVFATLYGVWSEAEGDVGNLAWLRGTVAGAAHLAIATYVGEADLDRTFGRLPTISDQASTRLSRLQAIHDPARRFSRRKPAVRTAA